ncbi:hypothetical protein GCM10009541_14610 [Micromonospora gifhornensis]
MVREEVLAFRRVAPLPSEDDESEGADERLEECQRLLLEIQGPVSDAEAQILAECFGKDNCFGLSWTLLHLVETAPMWAVNSPPADGANPWIEYLWIRYQNSLSDQGCDQCNRDG